MAEYPAPIIVVTSADLDREAHISSQAARLGAVHVMKRPEGTTTAGYKAFAAKLIEQVKLMSTVRVVHRARSGTGLSPSASPAATPPLVRVGAAPVKTDIVAIGSSTGGPAALYKILSELPADFPAPIVIVQHISFGFVEGLASWLDTASPLQVKVGKQGERIQAGSVYIAPDGQHMLVDRFGKISLNEAEMVGGFRPSVTPLFESVARANGPAAMGVILTGMGADGAVGMQSLHQAGAITLAQDQASCVVFGMPKEAIALGAIQHIVPLDKVAQKMTELVVV
jgi:two-component system chemotaxis response regulator CheB